MSHYEDLKWGGKLDACEICGKNVAVIGDARPVHAQCEAAESVSPAPQRYDWKHVPEICPTCDSREFVSNGPQHLVCLRCHLTAELDAKTAEYVSLREELDKMRAERDRYYELSGRPLVCSSCHLRTPISYNQCQPCREKRDAAESQLADMRKALRSEWWNNHGCDPCGKYGDDGQMQCGICMTDFVATELGKLQERVAELRLVAACRAVKP